MAAVLWIAAALEFQRFCLAISLVETGGIADPRTSTVAIDLLVDCSLAYRKFRTACLMFLGSESLVCSSTMLLLPWSSIDLHLDMSGPSSSVEVWALSTLIELHSSIDIPPASSLLIQKAIDHPSLRPLIQWKQSTSISLFESMKDHSLLDPWYLVWVEGFGFLGYFVEMGWLLLVLYFEDVVENFPSIRQVWMKSCDFGCPYPSSRLD